LRSLVLADTLQTAATEAGQTLSKAELKTLVRAKMGDIDAPRLALANKRLLALRGTSRQARQRSNPQRSRNVAIIGPLDRRLNGAGPARLAREI